MDIGIGVLLSPQARTIHRRNRLVLSKRIVEYDGARYVLHRFRRHTTFERFWRIVQQMSEAGASVQRIAARTVTVEQQRRHGYWVALDYVPGNTFGANPASRCLASFGRSLARLHSVEGPEGSALFAARCPKLPHTAYLRMAKDLSVDERAWIRASAVRLSRVRANNLTHGDLYAGNIITTPGGAVSLIDYELMAFEHAGIELAIALLRSFCRHTTDRRLLVESYLAHCSEQLVEVWGVHAADFLFAAAARLAVQRRRRCHRLKLANGLLRIRARLPFSDATNLESHIGRNEKLWRSAARHGVYYEHVAHCIAQHRLGITTLEPLEMLGKIDTEFFARK